MFLSRLWILVSLAIGAASVDTDKYKKLGGDAVLSPPSVSDRITSITWKHGADIAVEWYGQETVPYREFKDRCKLDFSTGALTISNLTVKDSGIYTAEINNKVMSPTEITVISAVPKPTVSTQCSSDGTRCTFTCEASITGAEPVSYSWMVDGKNRDESSKSLEKEKNDPEMVGKPISCQLKNPVSNERSDDVIPFPNSDYMPVGATVGGVAGTVIVFLIVVAVVLVIWWRRRRGSQNFNRDVSPCFACFSKRSSQSSEPSVRSQAYTPVQTEERAEEPSGRSQDKADEEEAQISMSNGTVQHEARGEGQDPESTQTGNGDEVKAQISMSNGTAVGYTTVDEIHNQEQNSESTQSKHEPEPSWRSQAYTPGQTEEGAEEPSVRSQAYTPGQTEERAEVQHEAHDQEQDPEAAQTGNGDEPSETSQDDTPGQREEGAEETSGRSQDGTPVQTEERAEEPSGRSQDKADEVKAQISMSNGTVAFTTVDEIHNQEQNSESTQSKHEAEPSGRSQDDTPGQTEERAEDTSEEGTPKL